jgi:hypothetical protein
MTDNPWRCLVKDQPPNETFFRVANHTKRSPFFYTCSADHVVHEVAADRDDPLVCTTSYLKLRDAGWTHFQVVPLPNCMPPRPTPDMPGDHHGVWVTNALHVYIGDSPTYTWSIVRGGICLGTPPPDSVPLWVAELATKIKWD